MPTASSVPRPPAEIDRAAVDILLSAIPDLVAIYRFGSTVRDTTRPDSDVDLAVLASRPVDPVERFDLAQRIAGRLGTDVDLVDLARASTVFRMQVLGDGLVLADCDRRAREEFEMLAWSDYARLQEERRPVLDVLVHERRVPIPDDVSLNKVAIIERCIERITQVHAGDDEAFLHDLNRQDSILLNLQRACEAAIDLAMRAVSIHRLGLPQETRHAFELLRDAGLVSAEVTERMVRMVGFRNLAVHDYRALDLDVVLDIVAHRLDDFRDFARAVLKARVRPRRPAPRR